MAVFVIEENRSSVVATLSDVVRISGGDYSCDSRHVLMIGDGWKGCND